jgi:hypothetical protein
MADPFANPMLEAMNVSDRPDPFAPWTPTSSIGLGGLAPSMADMAVTGERLIRQSQFGLPEMRKPPAANIGLSPTGDRLFVNGFETGVEDYASVLESERYLGGPSAGIPEGYTPLTQAQYSQYLQDIRDPSLGQLFKRGFESGGQQFTQLIGGALQAAGAEETGAGIVTSAGERLRQLAPFQREFTEIDSAGDMVDWFVSTLGTQTPLFLESVATGIAGAALGSATAGPGLGTAGGAIAGFFGKKAFRDKVVEAAAKYRAGQVTKDSAEYALLKNASAVAGGTIASGAGEYILGVGDVYNELREQGANPEDASARLTAAAAGLPYAALSILPEALIVGRILGAGGRAALPAPTTTTRVTPGGKTVVTTSPSLPRRGAELLRRGVGGAALFGGIEGASEAAQEGLVMGVSGQDLTSDEAIRRFINSFAAGAAVGGVLGGVANLRSRTPEGEPAPESKEPVNLLAPVSEPEMVSGTEGRPDFVAGAEVRPSRPSDTLYRGQVEPGQFGGAQGVLDLGGPTPTIGELRERSMQTGALPPNLLYDQETGQYSQEARIGDTGYDRLALPAPAPVADPNQLVLQFAPPAPEPVAQNVPPPTTAMGQQLLSIQRQQQFQAAQAQLEAQRQAELDRLGNVAQAQRQVDIAFPQEPQAQIPTREVAPPQQPVPRQLPLFTPAQAPRPSRGEALRRGIAGAGLPPLDREPTAAPRVDLRRSGQLPLFTQAGEPSVAALRQRAEPTVPTVEAGATQAPPTGFRGKPLTAFQRRAAAKFDELSGEGAFATLDADQRQEWYTEFKKFEDSQATKKPKEKKDAVPKQGAAKVPVQPKAKPSEKVGKKVRDTKKPAAKGEALKKKKVTKATDDDFERVLGKYNALSPAQRSQVAAKLGVTREQMPDLLDERTLDVDKAIDEVVGEPKTKKDGAAEAAKPTEKPKAPPPPTPATSRELFDTTVESIETTKDPYEYRMAMMVLFDYAFFPDSNDTKAGITKEALDFVNDLPVDKAFRQAVSVVIQDTGTIDAKKNADLFNTIVRAGMLSDVMASTDIKNLPNEYKVNQVNGDPVSQPKKVDGGLRSEGSVVADLIQELNTRTSAMPAAQQKTNIQKLVELYKAAKAAGQEDHESASGDPISSFFDADGNPYTYIVSKKLRVSTKPITKEQARALEDVGADIDDDYESPLSLDDWNYSRDVPDSDTGRYFRDTGGLITAPVPVGRVQLLVATFLRALSVKPRVSIFKNQADLKARNPELYRRAKAARPQGDFDVASAVGYSFGDGNVIIFSDRVATEQQLKFVLAHETLGHFGMRSLIGDQKFNALMERIYNLDSAIRNGVDAAMAARKQSKAEATEEFLADFAAQLDVSIVARIWNAIKNALNKLGVKFGDEAARYLVSQARRYVRNGDMSAMFDTKQVFRNLAAMETGQDPHGTGRFAQATDMRGDNIAAGLMQNNIGGLPSSLTEAAKFFTNSGIDTSAKLDRFLATFFSLLNYRARENPGFSAIHDVISAGRDLSMQMKVTMQEKLAPVLNRAVKFGYGNYSLGEAGGITEAQTADVNNLLYAGQRLSVSRLKDYRTLGKEQFFSIGEDGQPKPNQAEIDRIYDMGLLKFEQAKNGFEYEVIDFEDGKQVTKKDKFEGIKDLTEDDIRWRGYLLSRESVRDVELKLLEVRNLAYIQDRDLAFREIADITTDKELTPEENRNLDRLYKKYRDLYTANKIVNEDGDPTLNPESIVAANEFIVAVNSAILGKASDRNAAVAEYFQGKTADDVIAFIEAFKKRLIIPDDNVTKFTIQNRMKDIIIAEIGNEDADLFTKRSLATGYTPLLREGAYEVRVTAYDKAGNRVRLKQEYKDQLVYSQFENESEALAMAGSINDNLFEGKTYKVEAYNPQTMQFELMDVKLEAESSTALDAIAAPPDLNLNEFTRGLRQFGIVLNPNKMEQVIVALTKQNAKARQRLQRAFVPGAKPDAVIAITQHIESRASTIAKVTMRPKLNELMNLGLSQTQKLWNGDRQLLDTLKKNWETVEKDPNTTEEQKTIAKREYDKYAYMFDKTNPQGKAKRGNMYYNEAARQLAFLDNNKAIEESDFASGRVASTIRSYTSMAQLGASFATGALNYIGAVTNGLPYLATYNSKTAFGGGFGLGKSTSEFLVALNQVGLRNALLTKGGMNTAEFFDSMVERDNMNPQERAAAKQLRDKYGLTSVEAQFLAREIREGVMIPAQSNALTATSRGRATTGLGQKTMDTIMWTFNSTEQASRRALGLAAYRLAYQREITGGTSEKDAALKARDFAVEALRFTVGEYSVTNRPPAWKSGIQSFLYMYKVFPTTSIQLLSRLPPRGQVIMLTALFILGGITAFPFAEDLEDLVDTIAQSLGWKQGSIRGEIAKLIDEVAPGMSPYVLSGLANSVFTGDIGVRTSLGNFIPGTGLLLAGANTTRELMEIGGPAAGFLQQSFNTVVDAAQLAFTEKKTLADVLRDSPVTMARAFGDAYTYTQAGAIIDKRGYIVSPDVSTAEIVTRVLGFYPERASSEYQQIRISKRTADYQRQVSSGFQQAWIKAKMMGDDDRADAVADAVKDWNQAAKGTALEIRNFTRNANRALREAERPAMERFLRTAPRASREEIDRAATLLGYEEE